MKLLIKMSSLIFCVFTLSGCFGSIDEATQNALEACGIVKYVPPEGDSVVDENTPKKGEYVFAPPDFKTLWYPTDDIKSHQARSALWSERAISASSASKLDPKFASLSIPTTNLANMNQNVVTIREEMLKDGSTYYGGYDWTFLESYNTDLNTWKIECTAINNTLNK
jgi:hypothetical protein